MEAGTCRSGDSTPGRSGLERTGRSEVGCTDQYKQKGKSPAENLDGAFLGRITLLEQLSSRRAYVGDALLPS